MLQRVATLQAEARAPFHSVRNAAEPKLVAVVPVYNHERTVGAVAAALHAHGLPVLLVDDGSDDAGRRALETLAKGGGVRLVRLPRNSGKGAAVVAGLRAASVAGFTHALQVDADGQHALADVPRFIEAARRLPGTVVCGRPVFDASIPRLRLFSRYLNHFFVWLETLSFYRVRDSMCGFRLYPIRDVLEVIDQEGAGPRMDFDVEILVKLAWRGRELQWIDTRVSYPPDGVSHYQLLFDNLRLIGLHVRLLVQMLWRAPLMLWRRRSGPA